MSIEVAQMDAVGRLTVAIKRLEKKDAKIARLRAERNEAREAVVQKCRQYDADMLTMRDALNREIVQRDELLAALRFYGYDGNWNSSEMDADGGELARAAITKAHGERS